MTQRRPARPYRPSVQKSSGFTLGNLTNLAAIPLITAIFSVGGFYYVTNGTLTRHGDDITQIKTEIKQGNTEDLAAKAKIRDEFLASQVKTAEGIAKLDTRLAVAETTQKTQLETLNKIADNLQRIMTMPAAGR
jgi:hypothetical protein